MKRRDFLTLTAAIAATPWLSRCAADSLSAPAANLLSSQAGLLSVDLTAQLSPVNLARRQALLMAYNQQVPGPILQAQPGDRVEIRFTNRLQEPTNLHFHGLHIPPTGDADNIFRVANPGETLTYRFQIPEDHGAMLAWYHPHYHGLVAQQVFSGLAGLFVVRGTLDNLPEMQQAEEAFLVLQDFDLDRQGRVREPMPMFRRWGREGSLITVNGQQPPTLSIPQSGLLRLRLLNASVSRHYQLQLADHPWFLMATDGGALAAPTPVQTILLAPGQRADLLVPGNQPGGTYQLLNLPYDRGMGGMMSGMMGRGGPGQRMRQTQNTAPMVLAQLTYQAGPTVAMPTTLAPVEPLPQPSVQREFVLDHGIDPMTREPFLINGRAFDHDRIDTQAKLNTVEDWLIINKAGLDHPFHLHTNAFQVISRNGVPEPYPAWRDVVLVKAYEQVLIRIPFKDFPGKTVYHCHILDHEDQGMMGVIEMAT